jgi:diphosphomevalonate decarboxylase
MNAAGAGNAGNAGGLREAEATAVAHPNVALSKYWGKRPGDGNFPAVPSLSVTLAGLATRTRVRWTSAATRDRVVLNGRELQGGEAARALALIARVRQASGLSAWADVETTNDFPTASGLASSASGFAALAVAATAGHPGPGEWDAARISDLARRASASAARSLFGGFVELDAGPPSPRADDVLAARPVARADHLPLVVLVCVTTEAPKERSSTEGMQATLARSPFAGAWLAEAPRVHAELRAALLARDFERVGQLSEASALAMHASAIAAGVVYWSGATLDAIRAVRALRDAGVAAYFTIDAGPHVKVLVLAPDAPRARAALAATPGVLRVIEATPGEGARLVAPGGAR